jgi:hypothetical protein
MSQSAGAMFLLFRQPRRDKTTVGHASSLYQTRSCLNQPTVTSAAGLAFPILADKA